MKPIDVLRALVYPVTESAVLVPLVVFWLLLSLVTFPGLMGLFLMIVVGLFLMFVVVPAVFRYQMIVLEARARGKTPDTPDIDIFRWFGNAWTVFPVPVVLFLVFITVETADRFGTAWAILPVLFAGVFFPVSIAVLAITQSPLQSLNPVALYRLLKQCGQTFWMATAFLVIASWLSVEAQMLPTMLANFVQLLLSFSFFSLVGSLIEPYGLIEDVDIPVPLEKTAESVHDDLEKQRTHDLNHAYGFISRDNRAGGFDHIFKQVASDPDPVDAWAWYFNRMLAWEDPNHALFFAQHYVHDMLRHGEKTPAVKVMMRCRLLEEHWKPLREDLPAAIDAAESSANIELAAVLKGY